MSGDLTPAGAASPFDRIRQVRADGSEFWSARRLQGLMGYTKWQNLYTVVARAMQAASNTGMDVARDFLQVAQVTDAGNLGPKNREDYELTRQAAYLVAMNGDPNKPEVAAAQAYFATRTQQAELVEQRQQEMPGWAVALHALVDQQAAIELEQRRQAKQLAEVAAKVGAIEGAHDEFTALAYAKLNDFPTGRPYLARVGAAASRLMRQQGTKPHRRQDATFGWVNVYPIEILDEAFAATPVSGVAS